MTSELIVPEEQGYVMGALNSVMQLSGVLGALLPLALAGAYKTCGHLSETHSETCNSTAFGIPWLFAALSCMAAARITYRMPKEGSAGRANSLSASSFTSSTSRRFASDDEFGFGSSNSDTSTGSSADKTAYTDADADADADTGKRRVVSTDFKVGSDVDR